MTRKLVMNKKKKMNPSQNKSKKKSGIKDDQIKKIISRGPSADCDCAVCIFSKSQAPGNSYDLKDCPKCQELLKEDEE